MKNRFIAVFALLVLLVLMASTVQANSIEGSNQKALVYVSLDSPDDITRFATTRLPAYAILDEGLLTGADWKGQQTLREAGLTLKVLDSSLGQGPYYIAEARAGHLTLDYSNYGQVLLDLSGKVVLRMDSAQVNALTQSGAELQAISLTAKPLPTEKFDSSIPEVVVPDPLIQVMIDQVTETQVYTYDRQLAGELPVPVDGGFYTIPTRYTYSGVPIQKTTSFVGQHMQDLGLNVDYHIWNSATNPNVIGELPGLVNPDDIFIIGAHIDDVSGAPGADDNASGSVATLLASDILTQYQWGCTLRFAFWTGEEQGLLGSEAYAQRAYQNGENIVGYLNLDMIAWNTIGSNPAINLIYSNSLPPTLQLANLFSDVIGAYNLDLDPILGTGISGSDHSSFWQYGYTSILAIEDDLGGDFNPYYHSGQDTPAHTDPAYFTDFVKASIATYAHMSGCLIPSGIGQLDGHVTAAAGGAPIEDATITGDDDQGHSFSTITDASGYYTKTLLAGSYDVTATVYGYLPSTVNGVEIITDTVTTEDFALTALPTYTVSGYVTELGSGEPLSAQVEFLDAPVPPVNTDPSTGFYSLEVAQGTWTMRVTADQHAPQTVTVDVTGNVQQDFSLSPFCDVLFDDVENGNIGWTAQTPWAITTEASHSPTHSWTDSPGGNYQNYVNTSLISPIIDLTDFTGMKLNFWHTYMTETNYDYANVEYSIDGGATWTVVESYDGTSPSWTQQELLIPQLDGQDNARIRFHFTSDQSIVADGWHIDDIGLIGGGPGCMPADDPITGLAATSTSPDPLGETTTLTATVTGGTNIVYTWDFGDGATGNGAIVNHVYPAVGDYEATVTAANNTYSDTVTTTVVIEQAVTGLTATNDSPTFLGETTTFTATVTGGTNIVYTWDFGDGGTATGQVVTHVYASAGDYVVTVTASNALGSMEAETTAVVTPLSSKFFLPFVIRN